MSKFRVLTHTVLYIPQLYVKARILKHIWSKEENPRTVSVFSKGKHLFSFGDECSYTLF
jgi:hypothetical protein